MSDGDRGAIERPEAVTGTESPSGIVPADPSLGGGAATPSFGLPPGAADGLPRAAGSTSIGGHRFEWGSRTHVMGILNVTPDSFSGDGLLIEGGDPVAMAVELAIRMADEGADILDVGGESSRPGHAPVDAEEELRRVLPVVRAVHDRLPGMPISIDTVKPGVAAAAVEAGAGLVNDVWGVGPDDRLLRLAAERSVPIVLMHNRAEARYRSLMPEIVADLERAIERALAAGVPWESILVDPGFGFGKTPPQNLALLRELPALRILGRPVLLGTSRKSTLGKVLDLPPDERLEATVATTVLAAVAGLDVVRVHDVRANVRAARMADAVVRGGRAAGARMDVGSTAAAAVGARSPAGSSRLDRITLAGMTFHARHGVLEREREVPQRFEVDVEVGADLRDAGTSDDLGRTIDYSAVHAVVAPIVEGRSYRLIEALAEAIASELLAAFAAEEVTVRVRKPEVELGGPLDFAAVEIHRARGR